MISYFLINVSKIILLSIIIIKGLVQQLLKELGVDLEDPYEHVLALVLPYHLHKVLIVVNHGRISPHSEDALVSVFEFLSLRFLVLLVHLVVVLVEFSEGVQLDVHLGHFRFLNEVSEGVIE